MAAEASVPAVALTDEQLASEGVLERFARVGVWLLPVYGLANLIGTLSSQPDYKKDFPAYARYIRTDEFLASHLLASILGTGIGLLGFVALFVYLTLVADLALLRLRWWRRSWEWSTWWRCSGWPRSRNGRSGRRTWPAITTWCS
jgi:hypothetical protein